jgi:hypothetical protein
MKKFTFICSLLISGLIFAQAPDSAPPTPPQAEADVLSLFSDAYTSTQTLELADFTPPGNTATVIEVAGNNVFELVTTGGEFHGFNLSDAINLTAMENLHYDIWIAGEVQVGAIFNTTLSQHNGGHLTGQTAGYVDTNIIDVGQEGQWLSFDIELTADEFSNLTPEARRDIISQIVLTSTNLSDTGPIYLDNFYFWKNPSDPDSDATLSDLTLDGNTISGFSPATTTYNVELPFGTATAPTVDAVATQAGNGSSNVVITQASGVPGTATVDVTAPNGSDTETYTVNFTEGEELPPAAPVPSVASNAVIPILTNNTTYNDIGIQTLEPFGAVAEFYDLDNSGADDAFSLTGGNGGQINYFGFNFVDITSAGILHFDFYAETLNPDDNINVLLLGSDTTLNQNFRVSIDDTQTGVWQSFEIGLSGAESGLPNEFNGTPNSAFSELALVQFITGEVGSTLPATTFFISNVYFSGGTLSTADFEIGNNFSVYPNPASTQWTIKSNDANIGNIEIYNTLGRLVQSIEADASEVNIDASNLSSGIYFAKINSQSTSAKTVKLIKR